MLRFWKWWSNRATALQTHFATRRKGILFTKWRHMWYQAKLMRDSADLAVLHYHNFQMRKAFVVWEDLYVTNTLDRQLLAGALAWGRRKLVQRSWKVWVDASKGVYDGIDGH